MWFKGKKYGYGFTPSSIEGWLVVAAAMSLIIYFAKMDNVVYVGLTTLVLIYISYTKGPKPKWRWG